MNLRTMLLALGLPLIASIAAMQDKPVLYILGDSTVASSADGNPVQGWGKALQMHFDTSRLSIKNLAAGGTSSRTYFTGIVYNKKILKDRLWSETLQKIKAGDYVLLQFGHNDESPVIDTSRMRGSLKGISSDSLVVTNTFSQQREVVYTYGTYLKKFIDQIHAKKAFAIVCSPIPKNKWLGAAVVRNNFDYGRWAKETAEINGAGFIDLNRLIADEYDRIGKEKVSAEYFNADGIHTTQAGAALNASIIAQAIKGLSGISLRSFLK